MKKFINSSIKYLGAIFFLSIIYLGVSLPAKAADYPPDFVFREVFEGTTEISNFSCTWENTAKIRCGRGAGVAISGGDYAHYFFDTAATANSGHLVFKVGWEQGKEQESVNKWGWLHFANDSASKGRITNSPTDGEGGYYVTPIKNDPTFFSGPGSNLDDKSNVCAVNNIVIGCINGYNYDNIVAENNQGTIDKANKVVSDLKSNLEVLNSCDSSNAPLPFIFCPILNGITNAIGGLIGGVGEVTDAGGRKGLLISFLELPPISTNDPNGALNIVIGSVITVANSLYIIIFLLLIFSSSIPFLNLDSYTIKKTLPKFIGAVILTQFALPICSIIVDFFNIVALAIPNVLFALTKNLGLADPAGVTTGAKTVAGVAGFVAGGGLIAGGAAAVASVGWILILILAIAALVAAFVAIIYLLIRYFILYILIILSPLAFASWVLPGTEKFFKQWWTNFIKLNAMFVTIMALLSGSIAIAAIVSRIPGAANGALIASIIPIIALLLVPKTLKWTTQGMNALATGALNAVGKAGGKAASTGKGYVGKRTKEGVGERKEQFAANQFGMGRTRTAKMFGGRYAGRLPGKVAGKAKEEAGYEYAGMGNPDEVGAKLQGTMEKLAKRPFDAKLRGEAHAGLARLGQLGGGGRAQIASLQDSYRAAGGEAGNWKGLLGDSGIMGDMDAKAPELTSWEGNSSGFSDYTAANGETYKVRRSGAVDLQGKGATELGQLGASTIASAHQTTDRSEQFDKLNWQAAATMASTPQLQPKDGNSIAEWNKLASAAISHWDQVGIDAANRGDQAAFDRAVQNQNHAQTILDSLGS